ncbi:MAG: universal stress protein [Nitrospiraceae bacterium]
MNVLVATDGSKHGRWGLNWVATLPFVKLPRLTALHVLDRAAFRLPFRTKLEVQRVEARSRRTIERTKQQLAALKLKGTVRKERGAVVPVILKRVPKRDGLLVVGSQGLDAVDRFLLGSVSTKLLHHATCPVFVVKGDAAPLRQIILAIDGSSASATALEFMLTRFQPNRSAGRSRRMPIHVSVTHVMVPGFWVPITVKSKIPRIKSQGLTKENLKLIDQSVQKLIEAGFTAEPVYQLGNPAEEIMKVAVDQHADLIIMGAQGLDAIDRFLIGSVSMRVVQHANCSVLVVRAQTKHHRSILDRYPEISTEVMV